MRDEVPAAALFRYHFDAVYYAHVQLVGRILTTYGLPRYVLCAMKANTA